VIFIQNPFHPFTHERAIILSQLSRHKMVHAILEAPHNLHHSTIMQARYFLKISPVKLVLKIVQTYTNHISFKKKVHFDHPTLASVWF
jgi:hypothetical protein